MFMEKAIWLLCQTKWDNFLFLSREVCSIFHPDRTKTSSRDEQDVEGDPHRAAEAMTTHLFLFILSTLNRIISHPNEEVFEKLSTVNKSETMASHFSVNGENVDFGKWWRKPWRKWNITHILTCISFHVCISCVTNKWKTHFKRRVI